MMLQEISAKFVHKTTVEFPEGEFIVLREPAQNEIVSLSDDTEKDMKLFADIMPKCIIDSSFTDENGEKATGEEIVAELKKSGSLFNEVLATWLNDIPFQLRLRKKAK